MTATGHVFLKKNPPVLMKWTGGWIVSTLMKLLCHGAGFERTDPLGLVCYRHSETNNGTREIGPAIWSPLMRRTVPGTRAIFLSMKQAFLLGFRRVEWRCDSFNVVSPRAAERLGLTFEGRFCQHMTFNNRKHNTDYLSGIDGEWLAINQAISGWLSLRNFTSIASRSAN